MAEQGNNYISHHPRLMARRPSTTDNMTAAEKAAWKAQNAAQKCAPLDLTVSAKPARKSQRQEWQEFRSETIDMIRAAKRQGHFHILPQLVQRLNTAEEMLNNRALA